MTELVVRRQCLAHLFGPAGLVRHIWRPWWAYRRRDFHPNQQASNLSAQWLEHNRHRFTPVGETG